MPPKAILILILFIAILLTSQHARAPTPILRLTLNTNKQLYNVGENVKIYGSLYYEWEPNVPISDLVALQVNYPSAHGLCMLRTFATGSLQFKKWTVEILGVTPCDVSGNPKYNFTKGTFAYFKIDWRNNDDVSHYVIVTFTLCYGNSVPFAAYAPTAGELAPNENRSGIFSVPIPSGAIIGTASIYANALSNWPRENGSAYCPEKSASFNIVSTLGSTVLTESQEVNLLLAEVEPTYNLTFYIPKTGAFIGNYTVYATSRVLGTQQATNTTTYQVVLLGDINGDLVVDGQDYQLVKRAIPSAPGSPKWNPKADLNNDGLVDGQDFVLVKKYVGNSAKL